MAYRRYISHVRRAGSSPKLFCPCLSRARPLFFILFALPSSLRFLALPSLLPCLSPCSAPLASQTFLLAQLRERRFIGTDLKTATGSCAAVFSVLFSSPVLCPFLTLCLVGGLIARKSQASMGYHGMNSFLRVRFDGEEVKGR